MVSNPVNLEDLSVEDFRKFFDSFDHIFSDCDGVLWAKTPLPRTGEFFKLARSLGKTVHFISNNSLRTPENYKNHFDDSGIENGVENLTYPSIAISEYLKSKGFDKYAYCVASKQTQVIMESHGIKCKDGPDLACEYYGDFIQYLVDDPEIGAVVFDSDFRVNLPKLYKAITYLKRPEVMFINGASDRTVPLNGCLALGTGIFTEIVVENTNRKPVLLGKPGKMFGEFAMKRAGVTNPERVLFIGDMIEQDIGLGKAMGFKTMLVLTNTPKDKMMDNKTTRPDYYATGLGDVVPLLEKLSSTL